MICAWFPPVRVSVKPRSMARCETGRDGNASDRRGRLSEAALDGAVRGGAIWKRKSIPRVSVKPRSMARCEHIIGFDGAGSALVSVKPRSMARCEGAICAEIFSICGSQ